MSGKLFQALLTRLEKKYLVVMMLTMIGTLTGGEAVSSALRYCLCQPLDLSDFWRYIHLYVWYGMVWYGMVNVDLYSAIITKVSNALNTLVPGEKPGFQTLSKGLVVLLCSEVVRQRVPDHGAVHSECSASDSG